MTDYYDEDADQDPERVAWIYIFKYDTAYPLTRFCLLVAICAVGGWVLTNALTG